MHYDPMPKIEAVAPDLEVERRAQERLYGADLPRLEVVSPKFWVGIRNALFVEALFIGAGIALYKWLAS